MEYQSFWHSFTQTTGLMNRIFFMKNSNLFTLGSDIPVLDKLNFMAKVVALPDNSTFLREKVFSYFIPIKTGVITSE
jgi:hypothetical protein